MTYLWLYRHVGKFYYIFYGWSSYFNIYFVLYIFWIIYIAKEKEANKNMLMKYSWNANLPPYFLFSYKYGRVVVTFALFHFERRGPTNLKAIRFLLPGLSTNWPDRFIYLFFLFLVLIIFFNVVTRRPVATELVRMAKLSSSDLDPSSSCSVSGELYICIYYYIVYYMEIS